MIVPHYYESTEHTADCLVMVVLPLVVIITHYTKLTNTVVTCDYEAHYYYSTVTGLVKYIM